ncbi:MAG TPA: alpha/beta fold hydrolase [Verrucomicrobiae bacterium]|jgi:pimeloyl-ACP methyl ester carboxylesterase
MKPIRLLLIIALAFCASGCGTFIARSIARAPNRYPTWLAPRAPVMLAFNPKLLTNFPAQYVEVGPPSARLCYRVIEPADYGLKVTMTNWLTRARKDYDFTFKATVPGPTNAWTANPRGTILLLHGYGLAQFSMMPWALRLAEDGWRCILVDLRGHGKSTGKQIYFGLVETNDLSQMLDKLARDKQLIQPVSVVGESYGAALALRWKGVDPRVQSVVAIAPYASLSNSVLNISRQYAGWFPEFIIRSGLKKLPSVLQVSAKELDTTTVLRRKPVEALFIAGSEDNIAPTNDVKEVYSLASAGSEIFIVPGATHEGLTYYFPELVPVILPWLDGR